MESAKGRLDRSPSRESFAPRRSGSSYMGTARRDRKWTPSWLSGRSTSAKSDPTSGPSRRISTSTTASSTISTGTCSSIETRNSEPSNTYQLPTITSDDSDERECGENFSSVNDATAALQSLALSIPEDEEITYQTGRTPSGRANKDLPPVPKRSESRARSTRSRVSRLSSIANDDTAGLAEIEMATRDYKGYFRTSLTAHVPPAAAICGTMLLTTNLPHRRNQISSITTDDDEIDRAAILCEALEEAESADEALQSLYASNLQSALLAIRQSFDAAEQSYVVPDRIAWAMYQKTAEARNHPEKIATLWDHMAKLLKRIPPSLLVVIMFLLAIARRVHSRGILVNDASPAVFLLQNIFPKYVAEDASRILLKNWDHMPGDLPQVLESVNYRFGGRKSNVLALVASKRNSTAPPSAGKGGVQEIRSSEEREMQW